MTEHALPHFALPGGIGSRTTARPASADRPGLRLRGLRRRCGLTQAQLGGLVERSEDWVSMVERGVRPVNSLPVLQRMAEVLHVDVAALSGLAASDEPASTVVSAQGGGHAAAIRAVLAAMRQPWGAAALGVEASPADAAVNHQTADAIEAAWVQCDAADFAELAPRLGPLIRDTETAVRSPRWNVRGRPGFRAVSEVYHLVAATMLALGRAEVAEQAAHRALLAAERAGDAHLLTTAGLRLAAAYLADGDAEAALDVASGLTAGVDVPAFVDHNGPADRSEIALDGLEALTKARANARLGVVGEAERWAEAAERAACSLRQETAVTHLRFGPVTCTVELAHLDLDLRRPANAVMRVRELDESALPAVDRAAVLLVTARAHQQRGLSDLAIDALDAALKLAPNPIQHDARARQLRDELVRSRRARFDRRFRAIDSAFAPL